MAKLELTLQGSFDHIVEDMIHCICKVSLTASLEEHSDFRTSNGRCAVYVFERYSFWGGNRLSLTVTLYQDSNDPRIYASAITAGGSQAMFFKMNTLGEETFLEEAEDILNRYRYEGES
jgi:hypothetical protein